MKTRIFCILITLLLTVSLCLVVAAPAIATDPGTTIASSTIIFKKVDGWELTYEGGGIYSGVIPCEVDGAYDIYAKEGATAYFDDTPQVISDHDAWPTWNPDTPDWYQYSLHFYEDGGVQKWAIRNHAGASEADPWYNDEPSYPARGVPMSGMMDWDSMYALETDTGAYLAGMGTSKYPDKAASHGGGAGFWDMDWSWGSEAVPLEYPGYDVDITEVEIINEDGYLTVTMVPAPRPIPIVGGEVYPVSKMAILAPYAILVLAIIAIITTRQYVLKRNS